jgi:arylsulfatase
MFGRTSLTLYEGMADLLENDFINVKNTSFEIVADVETGDTPLNGVIVSQGGRFGGWSLFVKDGVPSYTYNYVGIDSTTATSSMALPKGKSTVRMDFAWDGGKPGAGGTATLYINDKSVASAKIEKTQCCIFSADESAGVGKDVETTVSEAYTPSTSHFSGKINKVTINLK